MQDTPHRIMLPRAIVRHANPRMAVTAPQWEGGDDDFEVALSRLARSWEEIQELRKRVLRLESGLQYATDKQNFAKAALLRDELQELRSKNPDALISSLSTQMQAAVKGERFEEAARYRDQLRILKQFLLEYQLTGFWNVTDGYFMLGQYGGQVGTKTGTLRFGYNGDTLTATGRDGKVYFNVNVSQPARDSRGPTVDFKVNGQAKEVYRIFPGEGPLPGGESVLGRMYLMDNETIGFWWSLEEVAGGGGGGGGQVRAAAGGARARDSGERLQDGEGEEGGVFISFKRVDESYEDHELNIAILNRLLKLDVSADDRQ